MTTDRAGGHDAEPPQDGGPADLVLAQLTRWWEQVIPATTRGRATTVISERSHRCAYHTPVPAGHHLLGVEVAPGPKSARLTVLIDDHRVGVADTTHPVPFAWQHGSANPHVIGACRHGQAKVHARLVAGTTGEDWEVRKSAAKAVARFKAPRAVLVCQKIGRLASGKGDSAWASDMS